MNKKKMALLAIILIAVALCSCSTTNRSQNNAGNAGVKSANDSIGNNANNNRSNYQPAAGANNNSVANNNGVYAQDHNWFTDINTWALGPIQPYGYTTETLSEALARIYNSVDDTEKSNTSNYYEKNPIEELNPYFRPVESTNRSTKLTY
ncbi:MAG: hypothetical protein FWG30_05775 [Eubacteriaceae bacterium]|nr:hypothetical protein [Eubacteriaceae bacterium]